MHRRWSTPLTTAVILLAALAARLACVAWFQPHLHPDDLETGQIARHILAGEGYSLHYFGPLRPTAAFPPAETFLNVAVHGFLGYGAPSFLVLVLIRSLLSVLTAWLLYRTVRLAFDPRLARAVLVVAAFHPAFIFYSAVTEMLTRPPYSMLAIAVVVNRVVHVARTASRRDAVLFGLAAGAGALVQPRLILFAGVALLWLVACRWRDGLLLTRRTAALSLISPLCALVVIAPWSIRNTIVFGELVLLRSDQGTLFWFGNNPSARGDFSNIPGPIWPDFEIPPAETLAPDVREAVRAADEVERDRILSRAAIDFVRENPGRFLALTGARLRFFWFGPVRARSSAVRVWLDRAFAVYSGLVLLGVMLGACLVRDRFGRLLLLLVLTYTGIHALAHAGMYYYRMSVEPYAIVLGLEGARQLLRRRRDDDEGHADLEHEDEGHEIEEDISEPMPDTAH